MKGAARTAAFVVAGVLVLLMLLGAASRVPTGPILSVSLHPVGWPTPIASWLPSTVVQTVPIPTGSARTLATVPDGTNPTPATANLLVGEATYVVPVPNAQVSQWYQTAYARRGWKLMESGSFGNVYSGIISRMMAFSPSLTDNRLTVNVLWTPDGRGASMVEYWITKVVLPPKPASAFLPSNIVKVVLHPIYAPGRSGITRTVTDHAWIARLVHLINALPTSADGVSFGCSPAGGVGMTLFTAAGGAIHATAYCDTITVSGTGLSDTHLAVEKMVEALFSPPTFSR